MMCPTPTSGDSAWPNRQVGGASLSTVVYRSKAVRDMSPPALHELTVAAQRRNRNEAVTGVMLYDDGQFFQWLEGPPAGVDRLMGSICQDPRHTGIEILNNQSVAARTFGDWSMKLAAPCPTLSPWHPDVIAPPREIIEGLRQRPEAAPALLKRLVPAAGSGRPDTSGQEMGSRIKLAPGATGTLRSVILSIVIPGLCDGVMAADARAAAARASELAELLIGAQDAAALELMREWRGGPERTGALYASLLEPAARRMGDLWNEDVCSEVDLTLGLCRLQTAVRLLTTDHVSAPLEGFDQPSVLIVPEPGEMHRLGSLLDDTMLNGAGWAPQSEYPRDDRALADMVSSSWFDVLDLSLSVALRRDHWLGRVTETIAQARRASQNPALIVVVGGRVFLEQAEAGTLVGANLTSKSAANVERSIMRTIGNTRSDSVSWEVSREVMVTPS